MSIRTTSSWSVSAWAIASSPEAARPTTAWRSAATRRWRACATEVFVLDHQHPCDCHGLLLGLRQGRTDGDREARVEQDESRSISLDKLCIARVSSTILQSVLGPVALVTVPAVAAISGVVRHSAL